jgi:hypothetical protein
MLPRKVAVAVVMAAGVTAEVATVEVATEAEGIFMVVAMAGGISAVGISVAGATSAARGISAAGGISGADRLRDRVFAAIVLLPSITPDQLPCGR